MRLYFSIIIFFFLFGFFISSVFASTQEFSTRANAIMEGIKINYSLYGNVKLEFAKVYDNSASSRKYPFYGNFIILDENKLENVSDFELKGLFAHELSHLDSYSNMSWIGLALYGLHYELSNSFRKDVERGTDLITIKKGFGRELLAFRIYRLKVANDRDKRLIEMYYLSPEEIKSLIDSVNT